LAFPALNHQVLTGKTAKQRFAAQEQRRHMFTIIGPQVIFRGSPEPLNKPQPPPHKPTGPGLSRCFIRFEHRSAQVRS